MNKLLYSFLKDMKLSLRGFYFYLEIIFALIFIAVLVFVVPENFDKSKTIYAHIALDESHARIVQEALKKTDDEIILLKSRDEIVSMLNKNRSSVGLYVSFENNKPVFEYILQGYENVKLRNILEVSIKTGFASQIPGYRSVTRTTTIDSNAQKLPDRINILPVFLALNAAFMGLFIIASYIFLDKDEGTIKAFAVTPASVTQYLLSKMGVMLISGLVSGLLAVLAVAGSNVSYFHLILLLIAFNLFGSAMGLLISSFFNTMSKAMGWLYVSIIVLGIAAVSYYMPAFSPFVIRLLPSYPMLFAFRETLLKQPDLSYIYTNTAVFLLLAAVVFLLANSRFKKTLTV